MRKNEMKKLIITAALVAATTGCAPHHVIAVPAALIGQTAANHMGQTPEELAKEACELLEETEAGRRKCEEEYTPPGREIHGGFQL
jgi:hypothetical protein